MEDIKSNKNNIEITSRKIYHVVTSPSLSELEHLVCMFMEENQDAIPVGGLVIERDGFAQALWYTTSEPHNSDGKIQKESHYERRDNKPVWVTYQDGEEVVEPYMHQDRHYSEYCASPSYCMCSQ